jgi:hypothetical protein
VILSIEFHDQQSASRLHVTALDDAANGGQHLPPHQRAPYAFSVVSLTVVGCDASHIIAQSAANQRAHIHTRRRVSITTIKELQATDREIVGHRWLQKASSGLLQE